MKKGARVRVKIDKFRGFYKDKVGVVLENDSAPYVDFGTFVDSVHQDYLEEVEPSIDNLVVGDIVVDTDGDEATVLAVLGDVFLRSVWTDHSCIEWYRKADAKKYGWKVKGQESDMVEVEVEGKKTKISRESAKNLNLI